MKDPITERFKKAGAAQTKLAIRDAVLGATSRSRHFNVDWSQVEVIESITMVDTDGLFWFVPGVSIVGGDDKVRPS